MKITIEEALRQAQDKASLLRYLALAASRSEENPDEAVWGGLHDISDEIAVLVERVRKALDVEALGIDLAR